MRSFPNESTRIYASLLLTRESVSTRQKELGRAESVLSGIGNAKTSIEDIQIMWG